MAEGKKDGKEMIRVSISKENIKRLQLYAQIKHPDIDVQIGSRSPKLGANDILTEMFAELEKLGGVKK